MGSDEGGSASEPRPGNMPTGLNEIDGAILHALAKPFVDGPGWTTPPTNEEILEELNQARIHISEHTLRTHLKQLYVSFGIATELTAAGKRIRLVEEFYKRQEGRRKEAQPEEAESEAAEAEEAEAEEAEVQQAEAPQAERQEAEAQEPEHKAALLNNETRWLERVRNAIRHRWWLTVGAAAVLVGAVAWLVIGVSGGESPAHVAPKAVGPKVIDVGLMPNARGRVNYCTGKDVVKSRDGTTYQHRQAVIDFNAKFEPDLRANLVMFPEEASLQYGRFSRDQRKRLGQCDVFYSDVVWTADFAHNNWLYDLSPYVRPRLKRFVPAMRDAARFDNRFWGVPKQADAGLLFYNADTVKKPPETWQELYKLASTKLAGTGENERFRTQGLASEALTVVFLELAYAAGAAEIITADHQAHIDQNAGLEALEFMVNGITTDAVPSNIVNQTEEKSIWAFGQKRADLMRNWPYAYEVLNDRARYPRVAGRVKVAPLPTWEGQARASVLGGHLLVISAFSKNPGAALQLVDFLSSKEAIKQDASEFGLAPALVDLYSDPEVQEKLPAFHDLKDAIDSARTRPVTPRYQEVSDAISKNINHALQGTLSPREALESANDAMQQVLDEVQGTRPP